MRRYSCPLSLGRLLAGGLVATGIVSLAACTSEDGPEPSVDPVTSAPAQTSAAPEPTGDAESFAVPEQCEDAFTTEMFDLLIGGDVPLNHEGVTMYSTEVAGALDVLDEVDALRCSWGPPSEHGIVTTIAEVSAEQTDAVREALLAESFSCDDSGVPVRCALSVSTPYGDNPESETTETHLLGEGGWVASRILNFDAEPDYSDSIAETLWR